MYIRQLNLADYKNLSLKLLPGPGLNIILAPNGSGKTNLLEAINYITTGSSFRGISDAYVFPDNKSVDFSSVEIELQKHTTLERMKLVWTPSHEQLAESGEGSVKKAYWLNTKKTNLMKFKHIFKCLVHAPTTMDIVIGGAKLRRDFLDGIILQLKPELKRSYNTYRKSVIQKSRLLQQDDITRDVKLRQLSYWNDLMVENGSLICEERIRLLSALQPIMAEMAAQIYSLENYWPDFQISSRYLSEPIKRQLVLADNFSAQLRHDLQHKLSENAAKELAAVRVLYGPHLDDFEFRLSGRNVRYASSRGQQRLYSLILHLAAAELLESELDQKIVLLLDDIFSELDPTHRAKTFQYLYQKTNNPSPNQIFLAMPEAADLKFSRKKVEMLELT